MVRDLKQLDRSLLSAGDCAKIDSSRKKYLIKVETEVFFSNDWRRYILRNYSDTSSELVEVYSLINKGKNESN